MEFWESPLEKLVINKNKWKGKTVLITGHTGFKGSWLSLWLQKLKVNVIGYSKSIPTTPSLFELANVNEGINSIYGDVRDFSNIQKIIKKYEPEIVIHMAAQSLVKKSYQNPIETFSTNIMGTVNIFEAIRKIGNPCIVVNVTSDKCYENRNKNEGYVETDPMGGHDPYSSSKGCSELITSSYRKSFFNENKKNEDKVSIASTRAGNVIGGGDWSQDRLIPDIMKAVIKKEKIEIRNPNSIRPWQFVLEPLHGYLLLAEKLIEYNSNYDEAWNFGPNDSELTSVSELIKKINKELGTEIKVEYNQSDIHEEEKLILNSDKAKIRLGWNTKMNLDLSIKWIVEWYKKYEKGEDMRKVTEQQIEKYSNME